MLNSERIETAFGVMTIGAGEDLSDSGCPNGPIVSPPLIIEDVKTGGAIREDHCFEPSLVPNIRICRYCGCAEPKPEIA